MYKISESSVEVLSLVLNMFDFGEGPTTRSSIRGANSEARSTPKKYITRAALHRASEYEETKADALRGLLKLAKPKEDTYSKLGQSRSSSVFSEQERNLSIESLPGPIISSIRWSCVFLSFNCLWYNRGDPSLTWAENQKVNLRIVDMRC